MDAPLMLVSAIVCALCATVLLCLSVADVIRLRRSGVPAIGPSVLLGGHSAYWLVMGFMTTGAVARMDADWAIVCVIAMCLAGPFMYQQSGGRHHLLAPFLAVMAGYFLYATLASMERVVLRVTIISVIALGAMIIVVSLGRAMRGRRLTQSA